MRIAMAQLNPTVGDFAGNLLRIEETLISLRESRPDLAVFPEMFLTGYPPRDLLERDWFVRRAEDTLERVLSLSKAHTDTALLVGTVTRSASGPGKGLLNSAALIRNGELLALRHKTLLPTYDVFDEARYFDPAQEIETVRLGSDVLGITICEDAWSESPTWRRPVYDSDPVAELARQGATIVINISASPFHAGKDAVRHALVAAHTARCGIPFVFVNQVGGNDELVFDGDSMLVTPDGRVHSRLPRFEESVALIDTDALGAGDDFVAVDETASVRDALVTGLRDYVTKCGFSSAVVGLSGGIDSALVYALASEALGPENVLGVTMPSPYSSEGSVEDSRTLAANVGGGFRIVPISDVYSSYLEALGSLAGEDGVGVTEENIQARIRGNILMAVSNKTGALLLSTGNKSELSVGYCTLYGDMSGGLSVISDVPKTMVYALAELINREREVIPRATIDKAPSAELRPGQLDQDTLPPYETLDRVLDLYVDGGLGIAEIANEGFDEDTVRWVVRAVERNEYKRRQAAPGLKVTSKAFGMGRRMPIAARYES